MDLSLPLTPKYTQLGDSAGPPPDDLFTTYAVFATIAFTLLVFIFEEYLSLRQKASYRKTEFPSELDSTVGAIDKERAAELKKQEKDCTPETSEEKGDKKEEGKNGDKKAKVDRNAPLLPQLRSKFDAAQSYGMDKVNFSLFASTYEVVEGVSFLLLGFMPFLWDKSCDVGARFGWTEGETEIKISLIFLGLTTIIGTITQLPFQLYSTFQIEKKHGFNKQTLGLFFSDQVKSLLLTAAIGGPFVALLLKIIQILTQQFVHRE